MQTLIQCKKKLLSFMSRYLTAAVLSLVIFSLIIHAWHLKITLPFFYNGDTIFTSTLIKSVIDAGWYDINKYIGAPGGYNLSDFPINTDNLNFIIIKIFSLFTKDYVVVYNLFLFLSVSVATLSALFVLQRMGLRYFFALSASILFALQPYFFLRIEVGHLFLAAYFIVPFITWLCVLIASNLFMVNNKRYRYLCWGGYVLACIVIASTGVYYAFFGIFFISLSGFITAINQRQASPFWQAIILCILIFSAIMVNLSPSIVYRISYGKNTEVAYREPAEAELYGLKITDMLLPIDHDRVRMLARLKEKYNSSAPLSKHESQYATLGIISAIGFIILLVALIVGANISREFNLLAKLNICGVLLGTIGGFGSLIAYTIFPSIRCYARISIFIAFFSLYAFFYFAQYLIEKYLCIRNTLSVWILLCFIVFIGIMSQTEPQFDRWQSEKTVATFNSDNQFVHKIENQMPIESMIFQLPYVPFPEHPPVFAMKDYENLRVYLHSRNLRWSYAAIRGRPLATWIEKTNRLPIKQMIKQISYAGYSGIYIDRNGYADHAYDIENKISSVLHIKPIVSIDNHLSFFDIRSYVRQLRKNELPAEWHQHVLNTRQKMMFYFDWSKGFYQLESGNGLTWRWCNKKGTLRITNNSEKSLNLKIRFKFYAGDPIPSKLVISGSILNETLNVNNGQSEFSKTILVPKGLHKLNFYSDARQLAAPDDPRQLFFRIQDFSWDLGS